MKKFNKKISVVIGTAALAVGLMALPVLASTSQNQGYGNGANMMSNQGTHAYTSAGSSVLDSLVTAGTLTQAQEAAILSSMQGIGNGGLKTALDSLVAAGTLTQTQEDTVLSSMQGKGMMGNQGPMQGTSMKGNHGSMQGTSMTGNHGSMQGTSMTGNHGSMQGTGMTGNHVSNQGKGMMSNR